MKSIIYVMYHEIEMQSVFFYGLFMDESLLRAKGMNPSKPILAFVDGFGFKNWGARNTHQVWW